MPTDNGRRRNSSFQRMGWALNGVQILRTKGGKQWLTYEQRYAGSVKIPSRIVTSAGAVGQENCTPWTDGEQQNER